MAKLTTQELLELIREARRIAPVGSRWQHYRGGKYIVVGHGFHANGEVAENEYKRYDGPGYDPIEEEIKFHRPTSEIFDFHEGQPKWVRID